MLILYGLYLCRMCEPCISNSYVLFMCHVHKGDFFQRLFTTDEQLSWTDRLQAISAMSTLPVARAMELFKDVEEKAASLTGEDMEIIREGGHVFFVCWFWLLDCLGCVGLAG